jgi:hypothetical protein
MLAHQRDRRTFGEPLDARPLPFATCILPFLALAVSGAILAGLDYQPRLSARVVGHGPNNLVLLVPADGRGNLLGRLRPGATVELETPEGRIQPLQVDRVGPLSCGTFARCWEISGPLRNSAAPRAFRRDAATVLRLPPRPLLGLWRKDAA